jgi:hypothetical protein
MRTDRGDSSIIFYRRHLIMATAGVSLASITGYGKTERASFLFGKVAKSFNKAELKGKTHRLQ